MSAEMKVMTPAITPNQLVFAVIREMKATNFNRSIPIRNTLEMMGSRGKPRAALKF
jgi:hypothetical protein